MPQFEILESTSRAVIKVIGVGGGGNNAVEHMLKSNLDGVNFVCANTDAQVLADSKVQTTLQFGDGITNGLGAGADPNVGRQAAVEDKGCCKRIRYDLCHRRYGRGHGDRCCSRYCRDS